MNPEEAVRDITRCRGCDAVIWWGVTKNGKRCPYDVVDGGYTDVSHFTTCPVARAFTKKGAKAS